MKETVLIEFYGLPGSGKSTLTKSVLSDEKLNASNILPLKLWRDYQKFDISFNSLLKITRVFLTILKNIKLFKGLIFLKSLGRKKLYLYRIYVLFKTLSMIRYYSKRYDLIILEEGVIQNLWSIITLLDSKNDIQYFFSKVKDSKFSLFFYLKVNSETASQRVILRSSKHKQTRFNGMTEKELVSVFNGNSYVFENFSEQDRWKTHTIDANSDIESNIKNIVELITHTTKRAFQQ